MNARPIIPAADAGDLLPHDRAVWRTGPILDRDRADRRKISVEFPGGLIEVTTADAVQSDDLTRWRYGWPPTKG